MQIKEKLTVTDPPQSTWPTAGATADAAPAPCAPPALIQPATPDELAAFVRENFDLTVPDRAVCAGHTSPWDYICRSVFEDEDLVVWSCRGGGKSHSAALATTLKAILNPASEQVILGGSREQSDRVAEHVRNLLLHRPDLVHRDSRQRKIRLANDSVIHVLAQSETSVRGIHADAIRCDEVELFDPAVWRAVWFCTTGRTTRRGALEALSTAHVPGGLMESLVHRCLEEEASYVASRCTSGPSVVQSRLARWCLWEVIERCGPERRCQDCLLAEDCRGAAREGAGFFHIDDAIAIKARSSRSAWETEMLCRGARRDQLVFPEFDLARHVGPQQCGTAEGGCATLTAGGGCATCQVPGRLADLPRHGLRLCRSAGVPVDPTCARRGRVRGG